MKLRKPEVLNDTHYPKDHVSDGHIYTLRQVLYQEEKEIMKSQSPFFQAHLPFYTNFSRFLSSRTAEFKNFWTDEEKKNYHSMENDKKDRYRQYLIHKYQDEAIKELGMDKRQATLDQQVRYSQDGSSCEGCPIRPEFQYTPSSGYQEILRKFKGNTEVFTIYNNTFCKCSRSPSSTSFENSKTLPQ